MEAYTHSSETDRLAEIATIIICTGFPMLPRFFIILRSRRLHPPDHKDKVPINRQQHSEAVWNHGHSESDSIEML